jgi:putative hydrolase of the HAD superfamily
VGVKLRPGTDTWIFDLDDTLYLRSSGLHDQMRLRVVRFIQNLIGCDAEAAGALHADYYQRYGTSMVGLARHHGVKPLDFLSFVHAVDLDNVLATETLKDALAALPGRRLIFTNASTAHARRILAHLQVADLFDDICDIELCGFIGKPERAAYETLLARYDVAPERTVFFDDRDVNLRIPFDLGMQTVLVDEQGDAADFEHVHAQTGDVASFLAGLLAMRDVVRLPSLQAAGSTC